MNEQESIIGLVGFNMTPRNEKTAWKQQGRFENKQEKEIGT